MSGQNTKVYGDKNGDRLVIKAGGELLLEAGAVITGLPQGIAVADSAATDVAGANAVINALLASLRAAGIIASE